MNYDTIRKMKKLELDTLEGTIGRKRKKEDSEKALKLFEPCNLICEQVIDFGHWILQLDATIESSPNIAIGFSNMTCSVYNLSNNQLAEVAELNGHTDVITEVKFNSDNSNLLYTSSLDGTVKLWDLRTPKDCCMKFIDTSRNETETTKPITCFDISANGRLLAAGTNVCGSDAYILFWDIRKAELMGGYWESHEDDITQVKFHMWNSNKLISAGVDMLINIYDLSQTCEDDALIGSLNTGCSIEKIRWLRNQPQDSISLLSHTCDVQLWKLDDVEPYARFNGAEISEKMILGDDIPRFVDVHEWNDSAFILGGCHKAYRLRTLYVENGALRELGNFVENKQEVRASFFNPHIGLLLTGGEEGILNAWDLSAMKSSFMKNINIKTEKNIKLEPKENITTIKKDNINVKTEKNIKLEPKENITTIKKDNVSI